MAGTGVAGTGVAGTGVAGAPGAVGERVRRQQPPSVRRSLALLVASFLAIVGIVTVAGVYLGVVVSTGRQTAEGAVPCLVAFSEGTDHARLRYELVPPRSVCTRTPAADLVEHRVVAEGSTVQFFGGLALAVVGVAGVIAVLVTGRRRGSPSRP